MAVKVALVPVSADQRGFEDRASPASHRAASRRALRLVQRALQEPVAEGLSFPHVRFSISHSGGIGAAAGAPPGCTRGLGIDFEPVRPVNPATARFFLTDRELQWAAGLQPAHRSMELLRLWTVKEAVFKADLGNEQALVGHYEVTEPGASTGWARRICGGVFGCHYSSVVDAAGVLTIAAAHAPNP